MLIVRLYFKQRIPGPSRVSSVDGLGYGLLDVLGELLHWGGQVLVSYVLVGLAYGWTLSSKAVQKIVPDDKVSQFSCVQIRCFRS